MRFHVYFGDFNFSIFLITGSISNGNFWFTFIVTQHESVIVYS